jgi:hypothetical protein
MSSQPEDWKGSKLDRLLRRFSDAAFACGEWDQHEADDSYDATSERLTRAERRVRDYVERLERVAARVQRGAPAPLWSDAHVAAAAEECWGIFNGDEIQRFDTQDIEGAWGWDADDFWGSDTNCWQYIFEMALLGSPLHQDALMYIMDVNPPMFGEMLIDFKPPYVRNFSRSDEFADAVEQRLVTGPDAPSWWELFNAGH